MTRRHRRLIAAAVAALTVAALAGRPQPDTVPPQAIHADAALVLSGDVDYLRVKHAAALVSSGQVKGLLLTGRGAGGDSAQEMRKRAISAGVPDHVIVLETASTTTRENLTFAAPLVQTNGWRRIALVTSQSHMTRALATARKTMPDVDWIAAPVPDAGSEGRARRLRAEEALKLLWYKARGWA